jgi:hypothetical protein
MLREKLPESLVPALLDGRVKPKNGRVLVKAVTWEQTDEMAAKVARIRGVPVEEVAAEMGIDLSAANDGRHIREAPYHEIVAVADDVDDPDIRPGALCQFVTAAADFAKDKRYVFVKAAHIIACEVAG